MLLSDFLNEPRERLQECETAIKVKEEIDENELLLEFLLQLQQRKQEAADKLHDTICLLSSDFEEVVVHQSISKKCGSLFEKSIEDELLAAEKVEKPLLLPASQKADRSELYSSVEKLDEDYTCSGSRKRSKLSTVTEENAASKSSRMMKNFKRLEATYFSTRCVPVKRTPKTREGSSFDDLSYREGTFRGTSSGGWINPFLESLSKYLCYSKFEVQAELKQGDLLNSSNLVCALGFDRDKELFATANVNRKIKIFECDMVLNQKLDIHYPVVEMTSRSKLSSICWNSYIRSQIASSNFEGVIQVKYFCVPYIMFKRQFSFGASTYTFQENHIFTICSCKSKFPYSTQTCSFLTKLSFILSCAVIKLMGKILISTFSKMGLF